MNANVNSGLVFGFSTVNAGQRNVEAAPTLVVVSTKGSFRITPVVSKALNIASGEYVMFISNVNNIDAAIAQKHEAIVAFCEANGLEVGSAEAAIAIHKEFDTWAIAKGIPEFDGKGNLKTAPERLTKNDKIKYVSQNFEEFLNSVLTSDEATEELKDSLTHEGVTKEEQIEVLSAFVKPQEVTKYKGSKVANPSSLSGCGIPLTFTDSNVWNQLKADMGDEATAMNREFELDIENMQDISIYDGYKEVTVKALILGESTDKEPNHVGRKDEDAE